MDEENCKHSRFRVIEIKFPIILIQGFFGSGKNLQVKGMECSMKSRKFCMGQNKIAKAKYQNIFLFICLFINFSPHYES